MTDSTWAQEIEQTNQEKMNRQLATARVKVIEEARKWFRQDTEGTGYRLARAILELEEIESAHALHGR